MQKLLFCLIYIFCGQLLFASPLGLGSVYDDLSLFLKDKLIEKYPFIDQSSIQLNYHKNNKLIDRGNKGKSAVNELFSSKVICQKFEKLYSIVTKL